MSAWSMPSWRGRLPGTLGLILIGVAALAAFGGLWWFHQQQVNALSTQLRRSEQALAEVRAQNDELTRQLASVTSERQALDERLDTLRAQLAEATADLERSRSGFEDLEERLRAFGEERAQLRAQVDALTAARAHDQDELVALEARKSELEQSVGRLRERISLLDRDYRALAQELERAQLTPHPGVNVVSSYGPSSQGAPAGNAAGTASPSLVPGTVELPPIIVRKDQAGMAVPVRGRLVEVNDTHAFVVVDKGSLDGVRVGMEFDIVRGATTIGRAAVVRVRPQLSAADILRHQTSGPLQVGDQAIQRGP